MSYTCGSPRYQFDVLTLCWEFTSVVRFLRMAGGYCGNPPLLKSAPKPSAELLDFSNSCQWDTCDDFLQSRLSVQPRSLGMLVSNCG